jgi:hypothetical protein
MSSGGGDDDPDDCDDSVDPADRFKGSDVRKAFFRIFLSLLHHYREHHLLTPSSSTFFSSSSATLPSSTIKAEAASNVPLDDDVLLQRQLVLQVTCDM